MRTFRASSVDAVLRDIDEEEKFRRRVENNHLMPAKWKRKRLAVLSAADKRKALDHEESNRYIEHERKIKAELDAEFAEEEGVAE